MNGSTAAQDLGFAATGPGAILHGNPITDISQDLLVVLSDGSRVGVNLSGLTTLDQVIGAFESADYRLIATINATGTGLNLTDTAGGKENIQVLPRNGSLAVQDLGLLADSGVAPVLFGTSIVSGTLRLDGGNDADTLIGTSGNDTFTGGGGNDVIIGGGGIDTLVETRDANMTLTNTSFSMGNAGTATLSGISQAVLTGGPSGDVIDASGFSGPRRSSAAPETTRSRAARVTI